MNVAIRRRAMTREAFLAWVENQKGRYEFDGFEPVATPGGTNNHGIISGNIYFALRRRFGGGPCRPMLPEAGGVATVGNKVRYPDVTVTCSPVAGTDRLIPNPVAVFEVVSATSAHGDHVDKRIEYQAVPSVVRYVVVEQARQELKVFRRDEGGAWQELPFGAGDTLDLPEIGTALPVEEIYDGVDFGS